MNFYQIDPALQEAIAAGDKPVRVKIELPINGHFEAVFEQDIVEANFFGLKEVAGGVSSRGEVLIRNEELAIRNESIPPGSEVRVSFSLGEGLPFFQRFVFFIDDKGIQDIKGPGRKRYVYIELRDLSATLRKTDEQRDWSSPAVFTYSVVCDKTQPHRSLVHGIAHRAGLAVSDIDCATIPVTLPFVRLTKNIWLELSALATAYLCHLECPTEKPLVFAHSVYQSEPLADSDCSYTFTGNDIFYLRKIARADYYRNTVRLKINMPIVLDKQQIWQYDDPPVFYDDFLQKHYPFKYPLARDIENGKYEARYRIKDNEGKERNVIYADHIDTQTEAENRLDYDGGPFSYSLYDTTTYHDRALVTLSKDNDGDLYHAAIYGRPIILDLNRSCYQKNNEAVAAYGTAALNVSGSYFSEFVVGDKPHYEDWVSRELAQRLQNGRVLTVRTHRALFHARVGARVKLGMRKCQQSWQEELEGVISAFSLRYKRDKAFVATFKINEE
jgi:hypothetical protein